MSFKPANEDHAVVECKFALGFSRPFSPTEMQSVIEARRQWRTQLPAFAVDEFDSSEGIVPLIIGTQNKSIAFANMRPDGTALWMMRCAANEITLICTNYTRWAPTWRDAQALFGQVINVMGSAYGSEASIPPLRLRSIALNVTDAFVSEEAEPALDLALKKSGRLPDAVFGAGPIWHCHTGWFDQLEDAACLNRLNLQVTRTPEFSHQLVVSHEQCFNFEERNLIDVAAGNVFLDRIHTIMSTLHQRNKDVMIELLNEGLADQIKLRGTGP